MVGELASVVVPIGLQSRAEVVLEHVGLDDLLALLALGAGLSVVLAEVLVISGDEANDALLSLMADVDADKHGLRGNLSSEVHSPEIAAKLGIDLSHNVEVDTIVIAVNGLAGNELRDNGAVGVNLIFNGRVEMLLAESVRNDD